MEALMLPDQTISAYNRRKNRSPHVNDFVYRRRLSGSVAGIPPSLYSSFSSVSPPLSSSFSSVSPSLSSFQSQRQPPLLPLPYAKTPPILSSPIKRETNRSKAKSVSVNSKGDFSRYQSTINRLGPDPSDLPKEVPKVLRSSSVKISSVAEFEKFSATIFSLSPPPSSLPLPKFSLRPKTQCIAEAVVVDSGATDDLRRLLRLQQ